MRRFARSPRVWILPAASLLAACFALADYLRRGSGVDRTPGALLVCVALGLLLLAGLLLALERLRGGFRVSLLILAILDIVGSLAASYLLHAWIVFGLTVIAFLGWLALLPQPAPAAQRSEVTA